MFDVLMGIGEELKIVDLFMGNESAALYTSYILITVLVFGTCILSIGKPKRWKSITVATSFLLFVVSSYFSMGELLGRAKPNDFITSTEISAEEAIVLQFHVVPGKKIYMMLLVGDSNIPRLYAFPWTEEKEKQLEKGQQKVKDGEIEKMKLIKPFAKNYDEEMVIYEEPWPLVAPKERMEHNIRDLNDMSFPTRPSNRDGVNKPTTKP